jgi:pyruvate kinase
MRKASTFNIMLDNAVEGSLKTGLVRDGDLVIIVAGSVVETAGSTNLITVEYIGRRGHIN